MAQIAYQRAEGAPPFPPASYWLRYTGLMRIMALDIGEKRVGVAVSDPGERVASPVVVLPADEVRANARSFQRVLEDWEPELLVCGLPQTRHIPGGAHTKNPLRKTFGGLDAMVWNSALLS